MIFLQEFDSGNVFTGLEALIVGNRGPERENSLDGMRSPRWPAAEMKVELGECCRSDQFSGYGRRMCDVMGMSTAGV